MISDKLFKFTTHSKEKKKIITKFECLGAHVQPIENLGNKGVPDINLCYRGYECWIEIKVAPDCLSKLQRDWIQLRKDAEGRCFVVNCISSKNKGVQYSCSDNTFRDLNGLVLYIINSINGTEWD